MKLQHDKTLKEIADQLNLPFKGPADLLVSGINVVHKVETGDLTYVDFHKYYDRALLSDASVIIIDKEVEVPVGKGIIISDDPFTHFNELTTHFRPFEAAAGMISPTAKIGEGTHLQPNVFVGNNVTIGKNCLIYPGVVIYDHTQIGDNVIVHANSVLGGDSFFYKTRSEPNKWYEKMHTCGRVIIEDRVEIGANCTIDRGATGDTVIGEGSKIDNHVHIAHGVVLGKNCLIAAQAGIAGKTTLEDEVILWGQAGLSKELTIGKGAIISAQAGVSKSLEGGKLYFGSPADEARKKWKEMAMIRKLPELFDKSED